MDELEVQLQVLQGPQPESLSGEPPAEEDSEDSEEEWPVDPVLLVNM